MIVHHAVDSGSLAFPNEPAQARPLYGTRGLLLTAASFRT
jgi:hypothetical protein